MKINDNLEQASQQTNRNSLSIFAPHMKISTENVMLSNNVKHIFNL